MSICLATLSISLILPHAVDENLVSSTPNYIVTVPSCIAFHHDDYPDANIPELLPNLRTRPPPPPPTTANSKGAAAATGRAEESSLLSTFSPWK